MRLHRVFEFARRVRARPVEIRRRSSLNLHLQIVQPTVSAQNKLIVRG